MKESEKLVEYRRIFSNGLQEEYELYSQVSNEIWRNEIEKIEKIREILFSEKMHDICMSKKYEEKVRKLVDNAATEKYHVLYATKKLQDLFMQLQKIVLDYDEEQKEFLREIQESLSVEEWDRFGGLLSDCQFFSKISNIQ